jgi:cobalt-zinc-cadmium efflux system outer membrane protein
MKDLARADSLRYRTGAITEVDAMQSRLEATTMLTDYYQTETEYKNMLTDLVIFAGGAEAIDDISNAEALNNMEKLRTIFLRYNLNDLITLAQDNRADLQAAIRNQELSAANLKLVKANRVIDLGLSISFAHNTVASNEEAFSPKYNTISAGISIPLKFSNFNKGELKAAQFTEQQAEAQYNAILLQIRKEVEQCHNNFISAFRRAELYQNSALADASTIFEKKKYSYQRGETSLLEVLDAQRTFNEIYRNYYETIYNANASLVELFRAAGIWETVVDD